MKARELLFKWPLRNWLFRDVNEMDISEVEYLLDIPRKQRNPEMTGELVALAFKKRGEDLANAVLEHNGLLQRINRPEKRQGYCFAPVVHNPDGIVRPLTEEEVEEYRKKEKETGNDNN